MCNFPYFKTYFINVTENRIHNRKSLSKRSSFLYFTIYTCAKNSVWKIEKSISNKIKNRSKNTYKQMELIEMMLQEIQKSQQKPKVN